jgi:anti-sigma factor RsiW
MNHDQEQVAGGDEELQALSALIDNELSSGERAAVLGRIANDPVAQQRTAAYEAQNAALQALFATDQAPQYIVVRPRARRWRQLVLAACWVVAGVALGRTAAWLVPGAGSEQPGFAQRADIAYAVYSPEQRHPVEVAAAQQAHLVTWLSTRLDRTLVIPPLTRYGYTLVGGRLLPGESGPAAQFMYQNPTGQRLTLYIANVQRPTTPLKLLRHGERRTYYWSYEGVGYALSGQLPEAQLRAISADACQALGGDANMWE